MKYGTALALLIAAPTFAADRCTEDEALKTYRAFVADTALVTSADDTRLYAYLTDDYAVALRTYITRMSAKKVMPNDAEPVWWETLPLDERRQHALMLLRGGRDIMGEPIRGRIEKTSEGLLIKRHVEETENVPFTDSPFAQPSFPQSPSGGGSTKHIHNYSDTWLASSWMNKSFGEFPVMTESRTVETVDSVVETVALVCNAGWKIRSEKRMVKRYAEAASGPDGAVLTFVRKDVYSLPPTKEKDGNLTSGADTQRTLDELAKEIISAQKDAAPAP